MEERHKKNNWRGPLTVAFEYALIIFATYLALKYSVFWLYPIYVVFVGTRQYAIAEVMTHEAAHRNLAANRTFNDALGILTTWPFFYVLTGYRRYHMEHHAVPLENAENNIYEQYEFWGMPKADEKVSDMRMKWLYVYRPFTGIMTIYHIRILLSNIYWDKNLVENYLMLGFWAAVIAICWQQGLLKELLLLWIIPQFVMIGMIDFWSEVGDHYRVKNGTTRSNLNPFFNKFIGYNIGHHELHHDDPRVPWHKLQTY